jgi:Uma2 family endonuclease
MPIYAAAGVGHLWLVDPEARTVEIHQRDDAGCRRIAGHSGAEKLAAEPFDALAIELAALWA